MTRWPSLARPNAGSRPGAGPGKGKNHEGRSIARGRHQGRSHAHFANWPLRRTHHAILCALLGMAPWVLLGPRESERSAPRRPLLAPRDQSSDLPNVGFGSKVTTLRGQKRAWPTEVDLSAADIPDIGSGHAAAACLRWRISAGRSQHIVGAIAEGHVVGGFAAAQIVHGGGVGGEFLRLER